MKKLILGIILLALTINQFSFVSFADETDDAISEMREAEAETHTYMCTSVSKMGNLLKMDRPALSMLIC